MSVSKLILACALVLGVSLSPTSASAKQVHGPVTGVIGLGEEGHTGGAGNGELLAPSGVAIDESTDDVYVVDKGNGRVEKYGAAGGYISQFNGGATPEGSFSEPTAVAVDQANGDIYVVDTGHNVVDKFTSAAAYICETSGVGRGCQASPSGPSTFSTPIGVAVDPTTGTPTSGDVYITDKENRVVDVFTALGDDVTQFQPGSPPWGLAVDSTGKVFVAVADEGRIQEYSPEGATELGRLRGGMRAVGVDPQSGNIFVGLERGGFGGPYGIEEFDSSRRELESFGFGAMSDPGVASPGIAVSSTSHAVYAADTAGNVVDIFGLVTIPDPTGCAASGITSTSATLTGEVNPRDTRAESLFQYGPESSYGLETPLGLVGGGAEVETDVPVEAPITGLTPGTTYHCRLDATNSTSIFNDGPDGTFETLPLAPVVDEVPAFATEVTTNSAILNGQVNPGNGATSYHFAYGLQAHSYPNALSHVGIGTGLTPIAVEQALPLGSLKPATTYHFALIATNAAETVIGADRTFTTLPASTPPESAPVISTGPAIAIAPNSAVLTGTVFPESTQTMYLFELGASTAYGTQIFGGEAGREGGPVPVSVAVGNLQPGTVYHYRLIAVNAVGTSIGPDRTFTTTTSPQQIFKPPTPGLVPIPVFPPVKNPKYKPPRKHHKPPHKKPKRRRAHGGRASRRHHGPASS